MAYVLIACAFALGILSDRLGKIADRTENLSDRNMIIFGQWFCGFGVLVLLVIAGLSM